jgi:hypothetical protein
LVQYTDGMFSMEAGELAEFFKNLLLLIPCALRVSFGQVLRQFASAC